MKSQEIEKLIGDLSLLNSETLEGLRELVNTYPYFATAHLLYLKNLKMINDPNFDDLLRKSSVFIPNRKVLFNLIKLNVIKKTPQDNQTISNDIIKNVFDNNNKNKQTPQEIATTDTNPENLQNTKQQEEHKDIFEKISALKEEKRKILEKNKELALKSAKTVEKLEKTEITEPLNKEVSQPIIENKEVIQPIIENKEVIQPIIENKEVIQPIIENKEVIQPIIENKEVIQPIIENKEVIQPIIENKEVIQPIIENKEVIQPIIENKEVIQPIIENKEVIQPIIENKEVIQPIIENKEVIQSIIENKEVIQSIIENKEVIQPIIENKEVIQPIIENKEVIQPIIENKEVIQSIIENKEVIQPIIENKEVIQPIIENKKILNDIEFEIIEDDITQGKIEINHLEEQNKDILHINDLFEIDLEDDQKSKEEKSAADRILEILNRKRTENKQDEKKEDLIVLDSDKQNLDSEAEFIETKENLDSEAEFVETKENLDSEAEFVETKENLDSEAEFVETKENLDSEAEFVETKDNLDSEAEFVETKDNLDSEAEFVETKDYLDSEAEFVETKEQNVEILETTETTETRIEQIIIDGIVIDENIETKITTDTVKIDTQDADNLNKEIVETTTVVEEKVEPKLSAAELIMQRINARKKIQNTEESEDVLKSNLSLEETEVIKDDNEIEIVDYQEEEVEEHETDNKFTASLTNQNIDITGLSLDETEVVKDEDEITNIINLSLEDTELVKDDDENEIVDYQEEVEEQETDNKFTASLTNQNIDITGLSLDETEVVKDEDETTNITNLSLDETELVKDDDTYYEDIVEESEITEDHLIDKFLASSPRINANKSLVNEGDISGDSAVDNDEMATETLAYIYTEQKLYESAISIYQKLINIKPEKKDYFIQEIERLRDLINDVKG